MFEEERNNTYMATDFFLFNLLRRLFSMKLSNEALFVRFIIQAMLFKLFVYLLLPTYISRLHNQFVIQNNAEKLTNKKKRPRKSVL